MGTQYLGNSASKFSFPMSNKFLSSRSQNPLVASLPEETLHPLNPGRRVPALPVPLELVHVLPEHVPGPEGRDQVVELCLLLMAVKEGEEVREMIKVCEVFIITLDDHYEVGGR